MGKICEGTQALTKLFFAQFDKLEHLPKRSDDTVYLYFYHGVIEVGVVTAMTQGDKIIVSLCSENKTEMSEQCWGQLLNIYRGKT